MIQNVRVIKYRDVPITVNVIWCSTYNRMMSTKYLATRLASLSTVPCERRGKGGRCPGVSPVADGKLNAKWSRTYTRTPICGEL